MELNALPLTHRATIPASYRDEMGHMNVMWYTYLFGQATVGLFRLVGMDLAYFKGKQAGSFALESHFRYLAEVRIGKQITISSRVLNRGEKRCHFMHYMILDESQELAATAEIVSGHIDMNRRRMSPYPPEIARALDQLIEAHDTLDWAAATCGAMRP